MADTPRQRGRRRLRIARVAAWALVVLGLAILAGWRLTDTPRVREWARQAVVDHLEQRLDREVALRAVDLDLPAVIELHGLRIASGAAGLRDDTPFLDLPYGRIVLAPTALLDRRLRLRRVELESPRVALRFWPGGSNLPDPEGEAADISVRIDQVAVQHASVSLDQEAVEFSFDARSLRARFASRADGRLRGEIDASPVLLRLPADASLPVDVDLDVDIGGDGLTVESLRFSGPDLVGSAAGGCWWDLGRQDLGRQDRAAVEEAHRACRLDAAGRVDGRLLARLGWLEDLEGPIDLDGTFDWRDQALGWRGSVRADAVTLWDRDLRDIEGDLSVDRYGIELQVDQVAHAGGTIDGTVDLRFRGRDTLHAELEHEGLRLDQLASDLGLDLDGIETVADGRLTYDCQLIDCVRGDARGEARLRPATRPAAVSTDAGPRSATPGFTGTVPYRAVAGVLTLGDRPSDGFPVRLRNPRQDLRVGGSYDWVTADGAFAFELATLDLGELAPFLPGAEAPEEPSQTGESGDDVGFEIDRSLWLPRSGTGDLQGALELAGGVPRLTTTLRLADVVTARQRFDRVAGSLVVDSAGIETLRLDIGNGDRAAAIAGVLPFGPGERTELRVDAYDWRLDAVRPWVPFELPIDGDATGHLEMTIEPDGSSRGLAVGRLAPARWGSVTLPRASARIGWNDDRIQVDRVEVSTAAGSARGGGRIDLTSGAVDLDLRTGTLDLGEPPLRDWLPRDEAAPLLDGRLRATVHVGGQVDEPTIALDARLLSPILRGRPLGAPGEAGTLVASLREERLEVDLRLPGDLRVTGGGRVADSLDLNFSVDAPRLDTWADLAPFTPRPSGDGEVSGQALAGGTPGGDTLEGSLAGTLRVTGSPRAPIGRLDLSPVELRLGERTLAATEPVVLRFTDGTVYVDTMQLRETSTGSVVTVGGSAAPGVGGSSDGSLDRQGPNFVDLAVDAQLDAAWARRLAPELLPTDAALRGIGRFAGRIGGTTQQPTLTGTLTLDGLDVDLPGIEEPLEDLRGDVRLDARGAAFDGLSADLGGGRIELTGRVDAPGGQLDGYRVQVDGRGVELDDLFGWAIEGDLELVVRGRRPADSLDASTDRSPGDRSPGDLAALEHTVVGQVALDRIAFQDEISLDPARLARAALRGRTVQIESTDDLLAAVSLDVQLRGEEALRISNDLASLRGDVDLSLRGTLARPVLFGEVDVDAGGRLVWNDSEYRVSRGRLVFADPYRLSPEIDLVATTRVRDFDITLALAGEPERLEATFSSEPPLPDVEVVRLLAGGESYVEPSGTADVRALEREEEQGSSAATFLYGQAASVIGERVNDLFGFDKFRIDPLTGSDGDNLSKARLTVGKRLRDDVFVTYSVDPSTTDNQRLQVEWQLTPTLVLVLTQNGDSSFSADARWESTF